MKICKIQIKNFRAFTDSSFSLSPYTCLVGANGAGKSTVLAALNVFFREQAVPGFDAQKLAIEDFHDGDVSRPIEITLHFNELNDAARAGLAAYVRHDELIVTARAEFDVEAGFASVRHFGERLGLREFTRYFGYEEGGAKAPELAAIYEELRATFPDLPADARTKDARREALHAYEASHPDRLVPIQSQDEFYGANSTGKLGGFVQWVYVPAVKDVAAEGLESKTSALGKLIRRAVRIHTDIDEQLATLESDVIERYQRLLDENRTGLTDIAASLQGRLAQWAHPDARIDLDWQQDARSSVKLVPPLAGVRAGEGPFLASLSRMGHGLQRSYLLAILQELANADADGAPTLIFGCEEPELYQHPPQARYLAKLLQDLSGGNNQVIVTTHSPLFVAGRGFENVRLVRRSAAARAPVVSGLTFVELCARIREAGGDDPARPEAGLIVKIHQALQPGIAEMLFSEVPVLVEGLEDVAYLTAQLYIADRWDEFRRLGCHLVPANGKDKLIQPLAISRLLGLPVFLVFDADGNATAERRPQHERDNRALMSLAGIGGPAFPDVVAAGSDYTIWPTTMAAAVTSELGDPFEAVKNRVRAQYGNEGRLEKSELYIAEVLTRASDAGLRSATLDHLLDRIIAHAHAARATAQAAVVAAVADVGTA